jgi:hypothetical protein
MKPPGHFNIERAIPNARETEIARNVVGFIRLLPGALPWAFTTTTNFWK